MTPEYVLLATGNQGKVREMRRMLAPLGINLVGISEWQTQAGLEPAPQVAETETTFRGNALLKARGYAAWANIPVVAEDSGICVAALDGAPGVYSARFAGVDGDDEANNQKLLRELDGVATADRGAYYHTSAVYLAGPDAEPIIAEAQWHGRILTEPVGDGGFGYDPLFYVPTHQCSSAQLDSAEKNRLSHRGQAIRALVDKLAAHWAAA